MTKLTKKPVFDSKTGAYDPKTPVFNPKTGVHNQKSQYSKYSGIYRMFGICSIPYVQNYLKLSRHN